MLTNWVMTVEIPPPHNKQRDFVRMIYSAITRTRLANDARVATKSSPVLPRA
jgi:hypothetical protein